MALTKKLWRQNNPDKVKAQKQRSYKRNYAAIHTRNSEYRKRNIEKVRAYERKYARKRQAFLAAAKELLGWI